jgi:hypothetical protein
MAAARRRSHPIPLRDRVRIRSLRRSDVEITFSNLKSFFDRARWLGRLNRYSERTIERISLDSSQGRIRSPRQLAQYIAASSVLHCADGWSYLGKAIFSLLQGDPHRGRHLAYYAELRAALSILAAEGLGIFKNRHFVIDGPDSVSKLETRQGTHEVVWHCLDYWSRQGHSGDVFSEIVSPYGRALNDWLTPVGGGRVVAPQAQVWFREWGMDLRQMPNDRDARNSSSYRPDGIPTSWYLAATEVLEFTRNLWTAFQPSEISRFEGIDQHILRISLEATYRGRTGLEPSDNRTAFRAWLDVLVDYQGFPSPVRQHWLDLLSRKTFPEDPPIFSYAAESADASDFGHFAILSRAALLLRVASGSTARLVGRAGFSIDSIEFWWNGFGQARGLWEGNKPADTLVDLWSDVEVWLDEIDEFEQRNPTVDRTFHRIRSELGAALPGLASCERMAIWGIAV